MCLGVLKYVVVSNTKATLIQRILLAKKHKTANRQFPKNRESLSANGQSHFIRSVI